MPRYLWMAILSVVLLIFIIIQAVMWLKRDPERFAQEFVDRSNEERTDMTRVSSYSQDTNHFKPTEAMYEPPGGMETPFRVNQYNSYVPA